MSIDTHTTYIGQRPTSPDLVGDCRVTVRDADLVEKPLRHVVHHSPTGFEWGYGGSGPADLALSILEDYLDDPDRSVRLYRGRCSRRAWDLHQSFKRKMIAGLPYYRWTITGAQIAAWLAHQPVSEPQSESVE